MLGVVLLLLLAIVFALGRLGIATPVNSVVDFANKQVESTLNTKTTNTTPTTNTTTNTTPPKSGTTVTPASSLTSGQMQMLKTFGIDPNTVTITAAMMACAEGKVGTARFAEIKNGATPTMFEGAKLVVCYR